MCNKSYRSNGEALPIVLLSGLAAGPSVFLPQAVEFPTLIVPSWPSPQYSDDVDSYAQRLADQLKSNGITGPCIVGGASFGGMLAHYLARHVDARCLVLIGSVRGPEELPIAAKVGRMFRPLAWLLPIRVGQLLVRPLQHVSVRKRFRLASGLARQFIQSDPRVMRWSLHALLAWRTRPEPSCPVFHIHGTRDRVLPIRRTTPTDVVEGGGHVISLSHAVEVNAFLRRVIAASS